MRLPSLTALRAFEAAARRGSFTAAADELNVSQSAVSQQIRALEEELGIALFRRSGPRIALTPAGRSLGDGLQSAFADVQKSVEAVRHRARPIVTVSLLPTFAVRWLTPRLDGFNRLHAGIDIRLATSVDPVLPDGNDVDVAIRDRDPRDARYRVDFLVEDTIFPVCRPGFVASDPAALSRMTLLHVDAEPRRDDWASWLAAAGIDGVDPRAGIRFENSTLAIQAALSGVGVAMGHWPFVIDDIASGQLEAPFAYVHRSGEGFMLICDAEEVSLPAVEAFRGWILEQAAALRRRNVLSFVAAGQRGGRS